MLKAQTRYCLLTNDVETHSIWHNRLRDETGRKVLLQGMPLLLDLYAEVGVRTTFYFTGYIARLFPELVRMILPYGHEVGCHGLSHEVHHGFDIMPYGEQVRHLEMARDILEQIAGTEVISFRAPALRVSTNTGRALQETGFRIDSSIASQRFDMFMSFGSRVKIQWLGAPRLPYRADPDNLFRKGEGSLIEVPLSAMLFPYLGTTMRIAPRATRLMARALNIETRLNGKPIVFDTHPNEFIDESEEKRQIARRASGFLSYLLQDAVRSRLKVRNLGPVAAPIYKREIEYFKMKGYRFTTVRSYCEEVGLL